MNWIVPPSDIAGILAGAVLFITLLRSQKATGFTEAALAELAKVTWPNPKETGLSTGVVSVMVGIATSFILLFDTLWAQVAERLLYR
ncbi:MAG: preprotein translocase subunit SecE [Deltaproteobacteria bacterium]|nr:preprotein translocase subunit SecE [Deltaproteobacteria bacterium]